MIQSFADAGTADVFDGRATRAARRACPPGLLAVSLAALRVPPGNRLEALRGDRQEQHSIRVNDQYRICFRWTDAGPAAVGIVDYH